MVSGYVIAFELYWAHLIYGMVWFWQWLIWNFGWRIWQAIWSQVSMVGINGMVNVLVVVGCRVLQN
jgi:hypothetical protein